MLWAALSAGKRTMKEVYGCIKSIIGLMPKVGMPNFGNCQILARDWLLANSRCQSHKKLPNVGNFGFCQMLACQILAMPNVGIKPIRLYQSYQKLVTFCEIGKKLLVKDHRTST